jgi:hypothetical protein
MFRIIPLPQQLQIFQLIRFHRFLRRTHAGVAGGKTLRADATAAEAFFILNHIRAAILAGTPHTIASFRVSYVFILSYFSFDSACAVSYLPFHICAALGQDQPAVL